MILRTLTLNSLNRFKPIYGVLDYHKFHKKVEGKGKVSTFLYEFWEVLYQGSKDTGKDAKKMVEYMLTPQKTALMLSDIKRIGNDLFKFIPFSFFLIIPGAELLLPPYLYLFPNAFPTTYLFDNGLEKRWITKDRKQMNSQRFLFQLIKTKIPTVELIRNNQEISSKNLQKMVLEHTDTLMKQLNYKHMNSEQLVHLCKFLGMEFFRGTYSVMKLTKLFVNIPVYLQNLYYWITRNPERKLVHNVKQNWNVKLPFPFEDLKRWLLLWQIKAHLNKVAKQDAAFRKYGYADQTYATLRTFARERGMTASMIQKEKTQGDLEYAIMCFKKDWIVYCHKEQVFENMQIWYAVLYYERFHRRIREEHEDRVRQHILH